jgi:hypothetical protein
LDDSSSFIYHVTARSNIQSILREGLVPQRGERSRACGEAVDAVYCFPTRADCETALGQWLGEAFVDLADDDGLAIMELKVPIGMPRYSDVGYEISFRELVPGQCVQRVYDEDWIVIHGEISKIEADGGGLAEQLPHMTVRKPRF